MKEHRLDSLQPPWPMKLKALVVLVVAIALAIWIRESRTALLFWQSLVDRRDAIAGSLLSVNASLLGFSITSFSVLLSVRNEDKVAKLRRFERASRQMWGALISASWATGLGAVSALLVLVFKSPLLADWVQTVFTAWLFSITFYVALTFVGVITVIQALVIILRPADAPPLHSSDVPEPSILLGPPNDD